MRPNRLAEPWRGALTPSIFVMSGIHPDASNIIQTPGNQEEPMDRTKQKKLETLQSQVATIASVTPFALSTDVTPHGIVVKDERTEVALTNDDLTLDEAISFLAGFIAGALAAKNGSAV